MTNRDLIIKWTAYALALLPGWMLQGYVLNAYPVFGAAPVLLPLCAVAVAVLEGPVAGAGYGLAVGLVWDALDPGLPGALVFLTALLGFGAGTLARYLLRQDLAGCFLCSAGALIAVDLLRVLYRLARRSAPLGAMASLALREILWSLCFVPLVYLLFHWVYDRVPKATVL